MSLKQSILSSVKELKNKGLDERKIAEIVQWSISDQTKFAISRFLFDILKTWNYNQIYLNEDNTEASKVIAKILESETWRIEERLRSENKRARFRKDEWTVRLPINRQAARWVHY